MRRLPSSIAQEFQFCQGSVLRISWGIKLHHTGDARNELVEILCTYIYIYVCVLYNPVINGIFTISTGSGFVPAN